MWSWEDKGVRAGKLGKNKKHERNNFRVHIYPFHDQTHLYLSCIIII